jgi:hypothetical protein
VSLLIITKQEKKIEEDHCLFSLFLPSHVGVPLLLVEKYIKDDIIFLHYLSVFSAVPALLKPPGEDNKGSAPRPHSVYRKKPTVQRSHTQREEPAASAEARKKRVPHAEKEVREYKEINDCKQSESKSVQERQRASERSLSYVVFVLSHFSLRQI